MARSFLLVLLLWLPALAFAGEEEFADGLQAEFEAQDRARALAHYAKVQRSDSVHAIAATKRRVFLLAANGDLRGAEREILFLSTFPGDLSESLQRLSLVKASPVSVDWRKRVEQIIESRQVTLNLPGVPIGEVAAFFQDITGINVVVAPSVDPKATSTCKLKNVKLRAGMEAAFGKDLTWSLVAGALVVHPRGTPFVLPKLSRAGIAGNAELYVSLARQKMTLDFGGTSVAQVADFLRDMTGENYVLVGAPQGKVTLRLKAVGVLDVLRLIAAQLGLSVDLAHGAVHIGKDLSGLNAPAVFPTPSTELDRQVEQRLRQWKSTLVFRGTPLGEVFGFLRDVTGLNFVSLSDVDLDEKVKLRIRDIEYLSALRLIASARGLSFTYRGGALVFGKDLGRLAPRLTRAELAINPAVAKRLTTQSLSMNFDSTPLRQAIDFLRGVTGLTFRVDSKIDLDLPCTLKLRNATLRDALSLLLASVDLRYRLTAEGVVIEPAKKP
ncbi:MAG: hypothetical protein JKY65_03025 [Planctomycetes bacterium]|nr:hypothetical protein [Planctomycetota bacterium]